MQDINGQSYISTVILPGSNVTHYIKDAEARAAITEVESSKQDNIAATGILKGTNNGIVAANAGEDYLAPINGFASPSADGNAIAFIDTVSQSTLGLISATKKTIPNASSSTAGIVKLGATGGADTYGSAAAAETAAKSYADSLITGLGSYLTLRGTKTSEAAIKAITSAAVGDVYINTADNSEWVCLTAINGTANASAWEKLGYTMDMSMFEEIENLGDMAYVDTASTTYQPEGSVTINSYTPEGAITPGSGTANYTPAGTVSTPTITVVPNTTTVNSITAVGTLPSWSASVNNETLEFSFDAGTLPTKGANTTVATSIQSATSTQPTFTGTGTELKFTGSAKAPTGSFTGTSATIVVSPDTAP